MTKSLSEIAVAYLDEQKNADKSLIPLGQINGFSGFIRKKVNLVGARPNMGLTNFLLSLAHEFASKGIYTVFISTHHSETEILKRIVRKNHNGSLKPSGSSLAEEITKMSQNSIGGHLHIHEMEDWGSYGMMLELLWDEIFSHDFKIIVIDTLKLNPRILQRICKDNDATIIIGYTLKGSVEKNGDRRPRYKDFVKSKINMKPVSVAVGLYRSEFYDISEFENGDSTEGVAEIICVKSPFEEENSIYRIKQEKYPL